MTETLKTKCCLEEFVSKKYHEVQSSTEAQEKLQNEVSTQS